MKRLPIFMLAACASMASCKKTFEVLKTRDPGKPVDVVESARPPGDLPADSSITPINTTIVARQMGTPLPGETTTLANNSLDSWGVYDTDLGAMWDTGLNEVMTCFGDNFSTANHSPDGWRANCIAISNDRSLRNDGMQYQSMIMDNGHVDELLHPTGAQLSNIVNAGISVHTTQYMQYMAVTARNVGGDPDLWTASFGELAYSDDYGQNWTRSGIQWSGTGNFVQAAYVKRNSFVYMFGTKAGRHGDVYVARVPEDDIKTPGSYYQYWNGADWSSTSEASAKPVTIGGAGEMSVAFNTRYNRYFMAYLSKTRNAIVFRDAANPEGPWSGEKVLLEETGNNVYAPNFHPWFMGGDDIYFTASHYNPVSPVEKWGVFLYRARIKGNDPFNMISEPGFEDFPSQPLNYKTQWNVIDGVSNNEAHTGTRSCKLESFTEGTYKIPLKQTIPVKKNTRYKISVWVKASTAPVSGFYFGIERPNGTFNSIFPVPNISTTNWTLLEYPFDSENDTQITIRSELYGYPGLSILLDDFSMVATN